jgi:predicted aspartyl protease
MRIVSRNALVIVALLAITPTPAFAQDCALKQLTSVDLKYDPSGGPLIPVTINGQPEAMLIDTGGYESTVTEQTVDSFHLSEVGLPRPFWLELADGKFMSRAAWLSELTIGPMRAKDWRFAVIPRAEAGSNNWAGTISPDILANYDVEFDFGAGKFSLLSQDHCPGQVVYWTKGAYASIPIEVSARDYHIRLTAMLDGKPVNVLIDTGTSTSAMNFSTARELFGIAPDDPALVRLWCPACAADSPLNGTVRYPFKTLSFGGVNVQNPRINLYPDTLKGLGNGYQNQLLIGMTILRELHLYIAYGEKKLYVTGADAH